MNIEPIDTAVDRSAQDNTVPWTICDTWIGVFLFALVILFWAFAAFFNLRVNFLENFGVVLLEVSYLIPVLVFLVIRKAGLRSLGFRRFDVKMMGVGCGLMLVGYFFIIFHNLVLMLFGISVQGDAFVKIFEQLDSPFWLFVMGILFAPVVEETLFRGFIFPGFRQQYGWKKAAVLSSTIFAAAHLQLVAFIPTFIPGLLFSYLYHKTNSTLPGMIIHLIVNAIGLFSLYAVSLLS